MIRAIVVLALIAVASATTTASDTAAATTAATTAAGATQSCQTGTATLTSGSYCSSYTSVTYCAAAADSAKITEIANELNYYTTSNVNDTFFATCSKYSGTVNVDGLKDTLCKHTAQECDSTTCGVTASTSTATAASTTAAQFFCCSYVQSTVNTYCTGANTDAIKAGTTFPAIGGITQCADSNCISGASSVAVSFAAVVLAALLALFAF